MRELGRRAGDCTHLFAGNRRQTGLAGEQEETRTPSERAQDLGRDVRWTEDPH